MLQKSDAGLHDNWCNKNRRQELKHNRTKCKQRCWLSVTSLSKVQLNACDFNFHKNKKNKKKEGIANNWKTKQSCISNQQITEFLTNTHQELTNVCAYSRWTSNPKLKKQLNFRFFLKPKRRNNAITKRTFVAIWTRAIRTSKKKKKRIMRFCTLEHIWKDE